MKLVALKRISSQRQTGAIFEEPNRMRARVLLALKAAAVHVDADPVVADVEQIEPSSASPSFMGRGRRRRGEAPGA